MSAAEFALWLEFYREHGFAVDRIETAIARAGTATAGAMGWKGSPADLLLKTAKRGCDPDRLLAFLDGCTPDKFPG